MATKWTETIEKSSAKERKEINNNLGQTLKYANIASNVYMRECIYLNDSCFSLVFFSLFPSNVLIEKLRIHFHYYCFFFSFIYFQPTKKKWTRNWDEQTQFSNIESIRETVMWLYRLLFKMN